MRKDKSNFIEFCGEPTNNSDGTVLQMDYGISDERHLKIRENSEAYPNENVEHRIANL